jgi:LDH2 family malate/lactate/ureidoglycolate dehydrogenase
MVDEKIRVQAPLLKNACKAAFVYGGVPDDHAEIAADVLVKTDLMGIHTHGVARLIPYLKRLNANLINPNPQIKILEPSPATRIMDGDHGLGAVVAMTGVTEAVRTAKKYGIGMVTCRNSNLMGACAPYVFEACEQGALLIGGTNAFPSMAPTGGKEVILGNNPIFFGVPRRDAPHFILDIAMSAAARGKMRDAQKRGEKIPLGWAIDRQGKPTDDPEAGMDGYLLPIGEHKGYGLAMAVDMFAGVLSGSGFGIGVLSMFKQWEEPQHIGHFFVAIDPSVFLPADEFDRRCSDFLSSITSSEPWDTAKPIVYPGEMCATRMQENSQEGITLDSRDWDAIQSAAVGKFELD